ncbi:uncharacterized protein [Periplaneta americana]|uniref:uncharacterized protein isoform X5 n=1 Tax=Periplaneta americana TaxID=6978 RepID=UPI0037E93D6D
MNKYHVIGTVTSVVLAVLFRMETDPSTFSAVQSAVFNSDHRDLFKFIAYPDTVEMWFHWISHFRSADSKLMGVGKLYQAVCSFPFVGKDIVKGRYKAPEADELSDFSDAETIVIRHSDQEEDYGEDHSVRSKKDSHDG